MAPVYVLMQVNLVLAYAMATQADSLTRSGVATLLGVNRLGGCVNGAGSPTTHHLKDAEVCLTRHLGRRAVLFRGDVHAADVRAVNLCPCGMGGR